MEPTARLDLARSLRFLTRPSTRRRRTRRRGSNLSSKARTGARASTSASTRTPTKRQAAAKAVYVTDNSYDSDIATTTNARSHILSINSFVIGTALPGALTYEVDGTLRTLTVAHANGGNAIEDFSAADFTSVGYGDPGFGGGVIGEVIVYSRELSAPERVQIENHFTARF